MTDKVIARVLAGDRHSFGTTGDASDAEEAAQEDFCTHTPGS